MKLRGHQDQIRPEIHLAPTCHPALVQNLDRPTALVGQDPFHVAEDLDALRHQHAVAQEDLRHARFVPEVSGEEWPYASRQT